jgi:hypothetical protein
MSNARFVHRFVLGTLPADRWTHEVRLAVLLHLVVAEREVRGAHDGLVDAVVATYGPLVRAHTERTGQAGLPETLIHSHVAAVDRLVAERAPTGVRTRADLDALTDELSGRPELRSDAPGRRLALVA